MHGVIHRAPFAAASAAALAVAAFALTGASGSAVARNGVVRPDTPGEPVPLAGHPFKSANWSGYVVTSKRHRITAVTSDFTVPSPGVSSGYASNWAGIGGFSKGDLIQAGTSEFFTPGKRYFAWYELLPGPETALHHCSGVPHCTVTAGDRMKVKIKQLSSGKWRISIDDATAGWSWRKTTKYKSSRSSADWILEAPTVSGQQSKLPHGLGTSFFGPTSTYTTTNSASRPIAKGNPVTIDLISPNKAREATPSRLASKGQSFNDCAWASSCARP